MRVTDLKKCCRFEHPPVTTQEDVTHVQRKTRFLSSYRFHAFAYFSSLRGSLSGDYKVKKFTCLRAQDPKLYHMAFAAKYPDQPLPTPTNRGTGRSMPIWPIH